MTENLTLQENLEFISPFNYITLSLYYRKSLNHWLNCFTLHVAFLDRNVSAALFLFTPQYIESFKRSPKGETVL